MPIVEYPQPLFDIGSDGMSFSEALRAQMRRHGDSHWHLHRAVVRPDEDLAVGTLRGWTSGKHAPRSASSMDILERIERRYRLPSGYLRAIVPVVWRGATVNRAGTHGSADRRLDRRPSRKGRKDGTDQGRPGPAPKPVVDHPQPLFEIGCEPAIFSEALALHIRRHGDSCRHLHRAVVRKGERFALSTLRAWAGGTKIPHSMFSMTILARIERRYRLPVGYFKTRFPRVARGRICPALASIGRSERHRLGWHLPDDFDSRSGSEQDEIIEWIRSNIFGKSRRYGRFLASAIKQRYGIAFTARHMVRSGKPAAPAALDEEMQSLVDFKTKTFCAIGAQRNGVWREESRNQKIDHLSLMFGALSAAADGPVAGLGIPLEQLTFGLLVFPELWDWFLRWRCNRRGFFTYGEVEMLAIGKALCRRETGWLRQSPDLSDRLRPVPLVSGHDVRRARSDWNGACDRLWAYAHMRAKDVHRIARVHRDPFEPILCVLEASSPLREYRRITEEIRRRIPDARRYPTSAAEAVRAFLMLRLGLHLGLRQRNLRELMLCKPGAPPRGERDLESMRRGELRWMESTGHWEAFIPSAAFKNSHSTFFDGRPFRLALPNLDGLYDQLHDYVRIHRQVLLKAAPDPGTFFVKTVRKDSSIPSYNQCTFYEAWRSAIERYGIWNPYTNRGAIAGLLPHGPHCVRDVIATHILKETGSFEQASFAIQDTPKTVAAHYGRFLPQDKAYFASKILNRAWKDSID